MINEKSLRKVEEFVLKKVVVNARTDKHCPGLIYIKQPPHSLPHPGICVNLREYLFLVFSELVFFLSR